MQIYGGLLHPVQLEVMLCRPVLTEEDAWVELSHRSQKCLCSASLLPLAWAQRLQCDADPGTPKPRSLSSSCNQSVLQIRKLHINASVLFLLFIIQHCLLIILTPQSYFSSPPRFTLFFIAAALMIVLSQLCHGLQRQNVSTLITACLGKYRLSHHFSNTIAPWKVFSFVDVFIKQVGAFICCRRV